MTIRHGLATIFLLFGLAVSILLIGLVAAYFVVSRGPSVEPHSTLVIRVRGDLSERQPLGGLNSFFKVGQSVRSVVESLRKAKVDSRISGVIIAPSASQKLWGKIQEIRDAVIDFRESGKPIVAYLEYGGEQGYYIATATNRIYLMPTSTLHLTGLATYEVFLRGVFDNIDAYPDMLHVGEYKTAANRYTEKTFTPAHREMSESLNHDLYEQLISGIASGRQISETQVRAFLDKGPFLPEDAVRVNLVDELAYEDEIYDKVSAAESDQQTIIEDSDYRMVSLSSLGLNKGPRIAVIYVSGVIASGESKFDLTGAQVVGSETLINSIRSVRDDKSIRAIVLRIDSPGGSALASDAIWRELVITREKKPIIASMSDLAASGGYYIAMPAHAIVAQPATLTGSIGIVMGKIIFAGTYEKLGVNIESVSDGRYAEIYSPIRRFSDEERSKIEQQMSTFYDRFVEKVAQARKTTAGRVDKVAQGRVWTGRQAQQLGLVDDLGGLDRALMLAKERAGISLDEEIELIFYPRQKNLFELVSASLAGGSARMPVPLAWASKYQGLNALIASLDLFRRGEPLALMPHVFLR